MGNIKHEKQIPKKKHFHRENDDYIIKWGHQHRSFANRSQSPSTRRAVVFRACWSCAPPSWRLVQVDGSTQSLPLPGVLKSGFGTSCDRFDQYMLLITNMYIYIYMQIIGVWYMSLVHIYLYIHIILYYIIIILYYIIIIYMY